MNTNKLKTYAPKARRDFIAAVTRRAAKFGLTAKGMSPSREEGQLVFIEGQPYPRSVGIQRRKLADRMAKQGFDRTLEAAAYTWFNRLAAIRYMELHGYLDHSFRVLSPSPLAGEGRGEGANSTRLPEILDHAQHVELPGLDRQRVIDLKMDGTRDEELYRDLLLAQCHALHQAMPFLFERLDDETELLLPDNLLQTDSLIRELVTAIPEHDWQEIEIIGWLYQFYISEKKDQVIGKVVKSEDIPAATQLFTPNWIVKYKVQNSLGAQWLATYPDSPLKGQMAYYIEPAEQTPEVQAQLDAITPSSLNPEELTLMDPACGSGHILVEGYDLFKAIYLERGYRPRDVAKLILEKNLFGLDIDARAAQLAGFALMMKARADDRRLFERGVKLNVMAFEEVVSDEWRVVSDLAVDQGLMEPIHELVSLFKHAKTFGSLIQVPEKLAAKLPVLKQLCESTSQDLFVTEALKQLWPLVELAELLAAKYDAVVANPPYMGAKYYCPVLKAFMNESYKAGKADLYGAFTLRNLQLAKESGHVGMITIPNWMFLSTFEPLRNAIVMEAPIASLVHIGRGVWGSDFGSCSYVLWRSSSASLRGRFLRLFDKQGSVASNDELERRFHANPRFSAVNDEFRKIPGSPVSYWLSDNARNTFERSRPIATIAPARQGLATAHNNRFVRAWFEVAINLIEFGCGSVKEAKKSPATWFPYNKGGDFRRWFGNQEFVVNWANDGAEIRGFTDDYGIQRSRPQNTQSYFRASVSWSDVTSGVPSFRYFPSGFIYDITGMSAQPEERYSLGVLAYSNTPIVTWFVKTLNPTLHFQIGNFSTLPYLESAFASRDFRFVEELIGHSRSDWDAYERSWDFQSLPLLSDKWRVTSDEKKDLTTHHSSLATSYTAWIAQNRETIAEIKRLEEENNRLFIDAYGLADELTPEVPIEQITLTVNPAYRYGKKVASGEWSVESGFGEELEARFRQDTMQELISYAIGCAMGRYSLDAPGLIYAHSGNVGFDPSRYATFPADADGIIPITDTDWFDDDATHRVVEFIAIAWKEVESGEWRVESEDGGKSLRSADASQSNPLTTPHSSLTTHHSSLTTHHSSLLEQNLQFLATNLSPKRDESSRETIRRYLSDSFFKDHLQTYKNRPIYWCFTSGKLKAFQCLVYLHRYNEGTLARMRMEYVVPLQSKMAARIDRLGDDIQAASTGAQAKRLQKERDKLTRQLEELRRFDEQLRHYADQRIALDLDDGVKVNYGKFGNLLAEVKTVTGAKPE